MRDLKNNIGVVAALAPAVQAATVNGAAVDLAGFGSAVAVVNTGAIAGAGDFTAKLQESDTTTSGDFTDVVPGDLIGAFPAALSADSVVRVGYGGTKRYVRVVLTKNGGTSIAAGAVVVKGHPSIVPVA